MNTNTNINDYTIEDLLTILNIQEDNPTRFQIKDATNALISNLKPENKQKLVTFLQEAEQKIIDGLFEDGGEEDEEEEEGDDVAYNNDRENIQYDENTQQGNWWQNQYPEQKNDEVERTKPTDRKQKVEIFDKEGKQNNAFVMNRERLGVLQSHPIPVVQGTINPNLKNIIKRIVSVDSQYRANVIPFSNNNINAPTFNTDFSFDLTERLSNVISMTLNSIQIPTSWYIFDDALGNTCFKYRVGTTEPIFVKMPSGNYTLTYLNSFFATYVLPDGTPAPLDLLLTYDEVTGKLVFSSNTANVTLIFYDTNTFNSCLDQSCGSTQMKINQNFGWTLGYRTTNENILETTLKLTVAALPISISALTSATNTPRTYFSIAQSPANLYGPAYFLLVIDDYNNNRVNNSLVTISNVSNKVDLPEYYSAAVQNANNTFSTVGCTNVLEQIDPALKTIPSVLPYMLRSSPRQLTQSQLYTANEILYNRTTYSNKVVGPSTADVLALLPLSNISSLRSNIFYDSTGQVSLTSNQVSQPYVVFGPPLAVYQRTYFGPVNIDRMRVRLLDDKSNLVNLNDVDWSFSLSIEQLYQY
jgi:hypothetical protein